MSRAKQNECYTAKQKAIQALADLEVDESEEDEPEIEIPKQIVAKLSKIPKKITKVAKASSSTDFNDEFELILDNTEEEEVPITNKIKLGYIMSKINYN